MNANVKEILLSQIMQIATMSDMPNVVPVGLKTVTDDGKIIIGNVMMVKTVENVKANGMVAISCGDYATNTIYEIKGSAVYEEDGDNLAIINKVAEDKGMPFRAKGAIVVTPCCITSIAPGPDNNKEVDWR
ncbi:MAG: pyridoxamine 5'-phosphate oxidase family protein [Lachnospiraceae bacterium]|nr:pyridoxamine 5'-phosphate oxidase family protein [Lachnospiraceae bacterium]